jgi:hypothetical protein
VDREAIARGQLGVDGRRIDSGVTELLLHLTQRDTLPDLVDRRPWRKSLPVAGRGTPFGPTTSTSAASA